MSQPSFGELGGEDPYAILGLAPRASDDDVLKARRRLLRSHHPDLPGGDLRRTQMITAAADILLDRVRRMAYEDMVRERDRAVFAGPAGATRRRVQPSYNPFDGSGQEGQGWHATGRRRHRGSERPSGSERPPGGTRATSGGAHRADGGAKHGPPSGHTQWGIFSGKGSPMGAAGAGVPRQRTRTLHGNGPAPEAGHAEHGFVGGWAFIRRCWLAALSAFDRVRHMNEDTRTTAAFCVTSSVLLLSIYVLWALIR